MDHGGTMAQDCYFWYQAYKSLLQHLVLSQSFSSWPLTSYGVAESKDAVPAECSPTSWGHSPQTAPDCQPGCPPGTWITAGPSGPPGASPFDGSSPAPEASSWAPAGVSAAFGLEPPPSNGASGAEAFSAPPSGVASPSEVTPVPSKHQGAGGVIADAVNFEVLSTQASDPPCKVVGGAVNGSQLVTKATPPISGPIFGFEHLECGEDVDYYGQEIVGLSTPPLNAGRTTSELLTRKRGRTVRWDPCPLISPRNDTTLAEPGPCERHSFQEDWTDIDTSCNKEYTVQPRYGNRPGMENEEDQDYVKLVGRNRMRIQLPAAYSRFGTPWSRWDLCRRISPRLLRLIQKESEAAMGLRSFGGGSRPSLCQQYVWPPLVGGATVCWRIGGYVIPGIMKVARTLMEDGVGTMQGPSMLIVVPTREQCRQVQCCCADVAKVTEIHSICEHDVPKKANCNGMGEPRGVAAAVSRPGTGRLEDCASLRCYQECRGLVFLYFPAPGVVWRVVCFYGLVTPGHSFGRNAIVENDKFLAELMGFASSRVSLPTLVVGDFNMPIEKSVTLRKMGEEGFVDLAELQSISQCIAPMPTCSSGGPGARPDRVYACHRARGAFMELRVCPMIRYSKHAHVFLSFKVKAVQEEAWGRRPVLKLVEDASEAKTFRDSGNWSTENARDLRIAFREEARANSDSMGDQSLEMSSEKRIGLLTSYMETQLLGIRKHEKLVTTDRHIGRGKQALQGRSLPRLPVRTVSEPFFVLGADVHSDMARRLCTQVRRMFDLEKKMGSALAAGRNRSRHLVPVWSAILRAGGFHRGFLHWVRKRTESLPVIGNQLPSALELGFAFGQIRKPRVAEITSLRETFDVKTADAVGNNRLRRKTPVIKTNVLQVDDSPVHICIGDEVTIRGQQHAVIGIGGDIAVLRPAFCPVNPGCVVTFARWVTSYNDLRRCMSKPWAKIWNSVPDDANIWDEFKAFAAPLLPWAPMKGYTLDVRDYRGAISKARSHSALGGDQWSVPELRAFPDEEVEVILEIFESLSNEEIPWDDYSLEGIIVMIAKIAKPLGGSDCRPLTIFSMIYRLWSRMHCARFTSWLVTWVDPGVCGMLPGRSVSDVASRITLRMELAVTTEVPVCGGVGDIVKCFNKIPWAPIEWILLQTGAVAGPVKTWMQGLRKVSRRLRMQGGLGESIRCAGGFPEGGPLSIVSAILIGHLWCSGMAARDGAARGYAYAGNLEFTCPSSTRSLEHMQFMAWMTQLMKLEISLPKAWLWSSHGAQRQRLRNDRTGDLLLVPVLLHDRDLGVRVAYCLQVRNSTATKRRAEALESLTRVQTSGRAFATKVSLVVHAVHAKGLYACEVTYISQADLDFYSTAKARALGICRGGYNKAIALFISAGPMVDPSYYILWQRILCLRRLWLGSAEGADDVRELLRSAPLHYRQGQVALFLRAIRSIGWNCNDDGEIACLGGVVLNLATSPLCELLVMSQHDYCRKLTGKANERSTITKAFHCISRQGTMLQSKVYGESQTALLRVTLTLANVASNWKAKCAGESPACEFCGEPDSVIHRARDCKAFVAVRGRHPSVNSQRQWRESELLTCHGLCEDTGSLDELRRRLQAITLPIAPDLTPPNGDRTPIFADGTGNQSKFPAWRLASGSIVHGVSGELLLAYHVPGLAQTVPRSELFAGLLAIRMFRFIDLYTDRQGLFDGLGALNAGGGQELRCSQNGDIWRMIANELEERPEGAVVAYKVKSHSSVQEDDTDRLRWMRKHNDLADHWAKHRNNIDRPDNFQTWYAREFQAVKDRQRIVDATQCFLLDLSETALQLRAAVKRQPGDVARPDRDGAKPYLTGTADRSGELNYNLRIRLPDHGLLEDKFLYGNTFANRMLRYLGRLRWADPEAGQSSRMVSYLELLIDFHISTGTRMPVRHIFGSQKTDMVWLLPDQDGRVANSEVSYQQELNTFDSCPNVMSVLYGYDVLPSLSDSIFTTICSQGTAQFRCKGTRFLAKLISPVKVEQQIQRFAESNRGRFKAADSKVDLSGAGPAIIRVQDLTKPTAPTYQQIEVNQRRHRKQMARAACWSALHTFPALGTGVFPVSLLISKDQGLRLAPIFIARLGWLGFAWRHSRAFPETLGFWACRSAWSSLPAILAGLHVVFYLGGMWCSHDLLGISLVERAVGVDATAANLVIPLAWAELISLVAFSVCIVIHYGRRVGSSGSQVQGIAESVSWSGVEVTGVQIRYGIESQTASGSPPEDSDWSGIEDDAIPDELEGDDYEFGKARHENISPLKPIQELEREFAHNPYLVRQFAELARSFKAWRPVRGDGNCYYRAVLFAWLERSLALGALENLRRFDSQLRSHRWSPQAASSVRICHRLLRAWIAQRSQCTSDAQVRELLCEVGKEFNKVRSDRAFILCLRHLIAEYLHTHAHDPVGGSMDQSNVLTYETWAMAISGAQNIDDYCEQHVYVMNKDAADHVQWVCPRVLQTMVRICMVDRDGTRCNFIDYGKGAMLPSSCHGGLPGESVKSAAQLVGTSGQRVPEIFLLLKPGHYDILIAREDHAAKLIDPDLRPSPVADRTHLGEPGGEAITGLAVEETQQLRRLCDSRWRAL
ncbi:unnamed protein product, partial [Polarella glacialis]